MSVREAYLPSDRHCTRLATLQARVLSFVCLLVGGLGLASGSLSALTTFESAPIATLAGIIAPVLFLSLPSLRLINVDDKMLSHLLCGGLILHLSLLASAANGTLFVAAAYLAAVPLIAVVTINVRGGAIYLVLTIAALVIVTPILMGPLWTLTLCTLSIGLTVMTGVVLRELRHLSSEYLEARDAALASDAAKSQFVAHMSHEIRTPLNGVIGMSSVLSKSTLSDQQRECVQVIDDSARLLLQIVNDILDLSKLSAEKVNLESVDVSVRDVVRKVVQAFRPAASEKGVIIQETVDPATPQYCKTDPTKLTQILTNLVSNAVKFTPEGVISVSVSSTQSESDNVRLVFRIKDSGVGMSPEALKAVFDPFVQADSSTTREFGGTGLGLPIVSRIVTAMGGEITVESTPSRGSTFTFKIDVPVSAEKARTNEETEDDVSVSRLTGLNVLVAEDNLTNQKVIALALRDKVKALTIVADGAAAIDAWRRDAFDLILMDVQMPGTDGYAATGEIRAEEAAMARVYTPIIALTANAFEDQNRKCLDAGMDGCITKPIELAKIEDKIGDILKAVKAAA